MKATHLHDFQILHILPLRVHELLNNVDPGTAGLYGGCRKGVVRREGLCRGESRCNRGRRRSRLEEEILRQLLHKVDHVADDLNKAIHQRREGALRAWYTP